MPLSRKRMSSSVRSGSAAIRSSSHCSCLFSGERLWPVPGLASTLPVVVQRSIQRIAVEAPTRADVPPPVHCHLLDD